MAVTRLKRKARKTVSRTKVKLQKLKSLNFKPVAKNVDVEKIKESFKQKQAGKPGDQETAEKQQKKKV